MSENDTKLERWRQFWQQANSDANWVAAKKATDAKRELIKQKLLDHLKAFLADTISVEQFRSEFDSKTRTEWSSFGLKGMSGAMFLNMLVKHISDSDLLTSKLKHVLMVPVDVDDAKLKLTQFLQFLQGLIQNGSATKRQLQPARASFFVSAWWHMQDTETWPIYYVSGRKSLDVEGTFNPTGDTVEDYFDFREAFNELAKALELNSWQCEHLLDWFNKYEETPDPPVVVPPVTDGGDDDDVVDDGEAKISHTQIQWLLAKIGHRFGCQVWIASNDQSKVWDGQSLGDLSIKSLPTLGLDSSSQKIISLIDVVWLKGTKQIAAAFEVEHTTSVYSGILRMSDLIALSPNLNFPLYLVAPEKRLAKVQRELSRPTFQTLELHKRCGYFSDEVLIKESGAILKWATDIAAIDRLASKVDDVELD